MYTVWDVFKILKHIYDKTVNFGNNVGFDSMLDINFD